MKEKRDKTFVWPSLIAKLVAGESQCLWAAWFKANFKYDKIPSDFNLIKWTVTHNALLHDRRDALERLGFRVLIEDQNSFKWKYSATAIVSAKPDIVAFGQDEDMAGEMQPVCTVEDAKSGRPKTSDHIQVMFYQIVLPKAVEEYRGVQFDGCIVYKDGIQNVDIPYEAANDESLKNEIWKTIDSICGAEVDCRRVASRSECKWCDISKADCPVRIEL